VRDRPSADPPATIAIYRDGDPRMAAESKSLYRGDGSIIALRERVVGEPAAMITLRRQVELSAGANAIALPEIPRGAERGSIWIRQVAGPGTVSVRKIRRPASLADPQSLRGRPVVAIVDGKRIEGVLVDLAPDGALLRTDSELLAIGPAMLELAGDAGETVAEVVASRRGGYTLELAYRTGELSWQLDLDLEVSASGLVGPAQVVVTPVIAVRNRLDAFAPATVELFEGRYDDAKRQLRSIWKGRMAIARGETRRPVGSREVEGALIYRYRGFFGDRPANRHHLRWGTGSVEQVELVLRLPPGSVPLAAAVARIGITAGGDVRRSHQVAIPDAGAKMDPLDLVLGVASDLRATRRQLYAKTSDGGRLLTESYEFAVFNMGEKPATVRVVEPLLRSREVEVTERPEGSRVTGRALEYDIAIAAGMRESFRFVARYRLRQ